jgi:sugar phosphate isomerase/epimerase
MHAEVVCRAKRALRTGEKVGGIGGSDWHGRIMAYADARRQRGQALSVGPLVYCGTCTFCVEGRCELREGYREISQHTQGGLAEYLAIAEDGVRHLPGLGRLSPCTGQLMSITEEPMAALKYSYFQLTFGQDEAYLHPEKTDQRLKRCGYDAIERTPPKGRYGRGVSMEAYAARHRALKQEFGLAISCVNECRGEMWDPYSPVYKTLTEPKTADLAVSETGTSVDFAVDVRAPFVTVAVAIRAPVDAANVRECAAVAVDALGRMCDYARSKSVRLVFEATNHLEMGRFVNTAVNHKRLIAMAGRDNLGIQLDWFHANFEELDAYEAVMDAQPLLWHMHFRDSNSLTPGYGTVDFRAVMRALKRTGYDGYCTVESAPMVPDADTAARDGIEHLTWCERIAEYQISGSFPNGFSVADRA